MDKFKNPVDELLRKDRIPHIFCPGCGIGTALNCLVRAIKEAGIDPDKVCVVSGIGCSSRVPGYLYLDSIHTTHGRSVAIAVGIELSNPELTTIVFAGDGDLFAIGGNHFIHAARRNNNIKVICINNYNYGMTGGQVGPTTPKGARATTAPYGNFEEPFNLPFLADSTGAVFVARWTTYHVRQLTSSIKKSLKKKGFTFIEVLSPCPELFIRRNRLGTALDEMKYFKEKSVIKHKVDTREVTLEFRGQIIVGEFVDEERPTCKEVMDEHFAKVLGEKFVKYEGPHQTRI